MILSIDILCSRCSECMELEKIVERVQSFYVDSRACEMMRGK